MTMPTTRETSYEDLGDSCDLLAVRAGVPLDAALELASCRLAELMQLLREQAEREEGLSLNGVFIAQVMLEGTKAMIDACSGGFLDMDVEVQP